MKSDLVLFINIHTHTHAEMGEQNARKLPWQEQMPQDFNHSLLEQAVQF